jgi:hypothetical protein
MNDSRYPYGIVVDTEEESNHVASLKEDFGAS